MKKLTGGCHCGNIRVAARLSRLAETYNPRACDCEFCVKHVAAYVSDEQGSLLIRIKSEHDSVRYRQGSKAAEFLLCKACGVLVAVLYQARGRIYAALNARTVDETASFGADQPISPKLLSEDERVARWREVWFSDVEIDHGAA